MFRTTPGITEPHMSRAPLATEGEATAGPDDENPFDEDSGTDGLLGDTPNQPQLLSGGGPPLGGGKVVDEMGDAAEERHEGAMNVFEYDPGKMGSFDPVDENGPF